MTVPGVAASDDTEEIAQRQDWSRDIPKTTSQDFDEINVTPQCSETCATNSASEDSMTGANDGKTCVGPVNNLEEISDAVPVEKFDENRCVGVVRCAGDIAGSCSPLPLRHDDSTVKNQNCDDMAGHCVCGCVIPQKESTSVYITELGTKSDERGSVHTGSEDEQSESASPSNLSICTCPTQSTLADFCRICHCEGNVELGPLIAPCYCRGTLRFVHQVCLQQWIKSSNIRRCELCRCLFVMDSKLKPFHKWKKLSMSTAERRKIICSVILHSIAITCVVWSLYVLIEKTASEVNNGELQWPFWTKLVVVAIGFTGGLVFLYIQCKVYVQLWRRLKAFNRVIFIRNNSSERATPAGTPGESEPVVVLETVGTLLANEQQTPGGPV